MNEELVKQTNEFYKLDRSSLAKLLKRICKEVILVDFPELKTKFPLL